jgi:predicted transposase/invertase (TIGR01784 family)
MARYLNPKIDLIFKRIFGEHERIVKSFLNAILPLKLNEQIVSLHYLPSEQVPIIPERKRSIVDVKCVDQQGKIFIVEMQVEWIPEFIQRMLFTTSTAYVQQLPKGGDYHLLQPVYGVALLANDFDQENKDQWYHHYQMVNVKDTNKTIDGLQLVFIELKKFESKRLRDRTLQNLWLRFMSEIDEYTQDIPEEILAVSEIQEAVTFLQESSYTPSELNYYQEYWDIVSTEKTIFASKFRAGKAEGKEERSIEIARAMLQEGVALEIIEKVTGLSIDDIQK